MTQKGRPDAHRQRLRIIGGVWRGRRIDFPATPELRPTPDRVRETLFNWLQEIIAGSRCLDLFAGSGALGFEAASRGADSVTMVDADPQVVSHLHRQAEALGARQVEFVMADAQAYLASSPEPFDIVFLDPPFGDGLLPEIYDALTRNRALKQGARIYIETGAGSDTIALLPEGWQWLRNKRAGNVYYHLARSA